MENVASGYTVHTAELVAGLADGLARAGAEGGARVVVLDHTGPAFCAGADLRTAGRADRGGASTPGPAPTFGAVLAAIMDSPLPVIARVAGHCLGGGIGLAAACDLSVAADDVRLGFTEVRLGVVPAIISVVCLAKMRRADALELFLTGEQVPASRAVEVGLLTRSVPAADLDATIAGWVAALRAGGPHALGVAKSLVHRGPRANRDEAFRSLATLSAELFSSSEAAEGRAAFIERRAPNWSR